jgi:hypothetical protein
MQFDMPDFVHHRCSVQWHVPCCTFTDANPPSLRLSHSEDLRPRQLIEIVEMFDPKVDFQMKFGEIIDIERRPN